jgi:hypothetical protein
MSKQKLSRFRDIEASIKRASNVEVFVTGRLDKAGTHAVVAVMEAHNGAPVTLAMSAFPVKGNEPPSRLHGDMHREYPEAYEASDFIIRQLTAKKTEARGGLMPFDVAPPPSDVALIELSLT